MDLSADSVREAKTRGLPFAITTDAHEANQLSLMQFGVDTARRAWLEPSDVINAGNLAQLARILKHTHVG
jgi:DNA polymerase (family 10)